MTWDYFCGYLKPRILYITKGYGIFADEIDYMCPKDIEPYELAHKIEIKEKDKIFHEWSANYILNAVFVAVDHCLAGKKAKSEFIKEPIFKRILDEDINKELTEEEIAEREIREQIKLESQYIASAINNKKLTK